MHPRVAKGTRYVGADCISFWFFFSAVGLSGVDLGNFLIKHVVEELQHEFPSITQYSTLSPIPGFKQWVKLQINHALEQQGTNHFYCYNINEIQKMKNN